jgi:hypothetical protein
MGSYLILIYVLFLFTIYQLNFSRSMLYRLYIWNRPLYFILKTIVTLVFIFIIDYVHKII